MAEESPKVKAPFLAAAVARKAGEVAASRAARPERELRARAADRPAARPLSAAAPPSGIGVIAEIKRRSPSAGALAEIADPRARARLYAAAGAAAVSVLTDRAFDGSLADLEAVAGSVGVPVLRKDFLVDPWQAWESRAAGADAALLVVAALDDRGLAAVAGAAREAGLGLLVEVHGADEIERAAALAPDAVGVNARDLATLEIDREAALAVLSAARAALGPGALLVLESGIRGPADVRRAAAAGADLVLVGEALARSADPASAVADLVAAGRPLAEAG